MLQFQFSIFTQELPRSSLGPFQPKLDRDSEFPACPRRDVATTTPSRASLAVIEAFTPGGTLSF